MPQEGIAVRTFFSFNRLSFPTIKNYLTFSVFLFISGFYYYYRIFNAFKAGTLALDFKNITTLPNDAKNAKQGTSENFKQIVSVGEILLALISKHRLLFYILLNTVCATITFVGKILISSLFETLTTQEETLLKKTFRRFCQTKFTFLIFISHHNLFEDILIWMPWMALQAVCVLLLELTSSRMSNPFNIVSSKSTRRRMFYVNWISSSLAFFMAIFVLCIRNYINFNYTLFLFSDCCLLFVQSIHLIFKLFTIVDSNSQRIQTSANTSYYGDLLYDVLHDSIEFINYLHMIFFSNLAVPYCCIFLFVQAKHYYTRISAKIQKHWQHQEIIRHISTCYVKANDEELQKNNTCTICWQIMKSARKLPCGHVFHELCLRRWLEQDSSCAICRQTLTLNLNNMMRGGELIGEEMDNALQYLVQAFSPHNNRLARWWTNLLFESMNEEQITAMVNQVSEMFPQISRDQILNVVRQTSSVTLAVEALIDNPDAFRAAPGGAENVDQVRNRNNMADVLDETQSSDEASTSSEELSSSHQELSETEPLLPSNQESQLRNRISSNNGFSSRNRMVSASCSSWFGQQIKTMVEVNRSKYLESTRADDIRHLC